MRKSLSMNSSKSFIGLLHCNQFWRLSRYSGQLLVRPETHESVNILSHKRPLHCSSCSLAKGRLNAKDDSIPFLHSKAHKFKVDDAYTVDTTKDRARQKFALPLGVSIFTVIIYFGFIRDYKKRDESIVGFLTRDISDKIPDDVRERISSEINQSKPTNQTTSEQSDK